MGKYTSLITRATKSVEYWAQRAMRDFVGELLARMDAKEMSQAQLADALGTSAAYVSKVVRGDVNFTLETMTKLATAVGGKLEVRIIERDASMVVAPAEWHIEVDPRRVTSSAKTVVLRLDEALIAANERNVSPQFFVVPNRLRRVA